MTGSSDLAEGPASWRAVRAELLRRIQERVWPPGAQIPNEVDLAEEFACARATVSRALRDLAERGLVTRKRRAGTRVADNPAGHATLRIPILREEIEARGSAHRHAVLTRRFAQPPAATRAAMNLAEGVEALAVSTLHLADGRPYALDERWINLDAAPAAADAPFDVVSPNEWLVRNAAFTHGDVALSATAAEAGAAERLNATIGDALLTLERVTWRGDRSVTLARIVFAPGHRLRVDLSP